ncbi:MAG TPA: alcohol dehydrogenase catalytic domain-containing protein [Ktedonobacterales bacterium]
MRAVIFHRHDDVRVEDIPTPSVGAGDILVRVAGCGLCGSDILKITAAADPPVALGHELTGTVAASESSQFAPGERVVVAHHVPCGTCAFCTGGSPTMCDEFKASHLDPCGLAEYVRVSAAHVRQVVLPLPETLSDEAASFTEPLACCLRALGRARLNTVASAVVVGLGAMGLLMVQALLAVQPGTHVVGVDPIPERRELAVGLGAARAWAPGVALAAGTRQGAGARGADLVVLTTGAQAALDTAQTLVRDGGEVVLFAAPAGAHVDFALWDWYHRELRLTASYSSAPGDLREALELIAAGRVRTTQLISHRLPVTAFHEGLTLARTHQALKVYFKLDA